jgi:hypothetical protein
MTDKPLPSLRDLIKQHADDDLRWFGDTLEVIQSLPYNTLALCGEAGELANIIKKVERGSLQWNDPRVRFDAAMEAIDIFIYLLKIFYLMDVDPYLLYMKKRAINDTRFTAERKERDRRNGAVPADAE